MQGTSGISNPATVDPATEAPADRSLAFFLAHSIVLVCVAAFAAGVVASHVAQLRGVAFHWFAIGAGTIMLSVVVGAIAIAIPHARRLPADRPVVGGLLALAIFCATVNLVVHQPNHDDIYYSANAVYHVQHPAEPMSFKNFALPLPRGPNTLYFGGTSVAHEYVESAIAYCLHVEYAIVYYVLAPALIGLLTPLVLFCVICRFIDNTRGALLGTFCVLLSLLAMWETMRSPGVWFFLRTFHGKSTVMALAVPWFACLTLEFFHRPSVGGWAALFAIGVAAVGLTPSAIILLPPLSCCLLVGLAVAGWLRWRDAGKTVTYFLAQAYLVANALFMRAHADEVAVNSPVNVGWPLTFWGHAKFFIGPHFPFTLVFFLVLTPLALRQLSGWQRRFLLGWLGASVVYLNPWIAPWLILHVTTPNIYWRMFYTLPFPLVAGIGVAALFSRLNDPVRQRMVAVIGGVFVIVLAVDIARLSRRHSEGWLGAPGITVSRHDLKRCRSIIAVAPPGPMLAPEPIAEVFPIINSFYPQMCWRPAIVDWLPSDQAEIARRDGAGRYIDDAGGTAVDLAEVLRGPLVRSVVILRSVVEKPESARILSENGFTERHDVYQYVVACRR